MKRFWILLLLPVLIFAGDRDFFDRYFLDQTMRIDYIHVGDADEAFITLDQIYVQGIWAGSLERLVDPINNGRYTIKVYDVASNALVYSRGFDSYFGEYQTTNPAIAGIKRSYHESALIPCPKKRIRFVIEARDRQHLSSPIFIREIDPASVDIQRQAPWGNVRLYNAQHSGDPHDKVDLVWIAEGYTAEEYDRFVEDVDHYKTLLFNTEPYQRNRKRFNVTGVFKPSSGHIDEPRKGIYHHTAVEATFNALGLARYVLTENNRALRDVAAHAPYDGIIILVNHERYGGGGIYNTYAINTTRDSRSDGVFLHEFGHSFAGLADEYYSSDVAYNEFYPPGAEPLEPNITALMDPKHVKWQDMLSQGVEIPTDWGQDERDSLDATYYRFLKEKSEALAALEEDVEPMEIQKLKDAFDAKISVVQDKREAARTRYAHLDGKVGAFEGAGYSAKGLYRPCATCLMYSTGEGFFCPVCEKAIERMIKYYTE